MLTLILTIALTRPCEVKQIHFDRIDVNHYYRQDGTLAFDQLIFWRWSRSERRFISFGFVFLKDGRKDGQWIGSDKVPKRCGDRYAVELTYHDVRYRVSCDCLIYSFTTHDPEAVDRQRFPDFRREWE